MLSIIHLHLISSALYLAVPVFSAFILYLPTFLHNERVFSYYFVVTSLGITSAVHGCIGVAAYELSPSMALRLAEVISLSVLHVQLGASLIYSICGFFGFYRPRIYHVGVAISVVLVVACAAVASFVGPFIAVPIGSIISLAAISAPLPFLVISFALLLARLREGRSLPRYVHYTRIDPRLAPHYHASVLHYWLSIISAQTAGTISAAYGLLRVVGQPDDETVAFYRIVESIFAVLWICATILSYYSFSTFPRSLSTSIFHLFRRNRPTSIASTASDLLNLRDPFAVLPSQPPTPIPTSAVCLVRKLSARLGINGDEKTLHKKQSTEDLIKILDKDFKITLSPPPEAQMGERTLWRSSVAESESEDGSDWLIVPPAYAYAY